MKKLLLFLGIVGFLFSCNKDSETTLPSNLCEKQVIINHDEYNSAIIDPSMTINNLEINGNCLNINFTSGGCDGNSWIVKLIDSGSVEESNPQKRLLVFSLKNEEVCDALITKDISFDISDLQVNGNEVVLNITNTHNSILYEY